MKRKTLLCRAGLGLALALGADTALPQAQAPARPTQMQGFEATGQLPANYTPEEAAAVAVIKRWIDTTNTKDLAAHMALVDDNVLYRADPAERLGRGARGYCADFGFMRSTAWVRLDELYVIGGPNDALVLVKRADINFPAGAGVANFGGYVVALADLVRVKNGKITEWYDIPINKVGPLVNEPVNSRPLTTDVPDACMKYPAPASAPAPTTPARAAAPVQPHPVTQTVLANGMSSYGTTKLESWFNVEEQRAAEAIRGWFAAWQAGNPKLLAAFVDQKAIFRANPTSEIGNGRDALLRAACGAMGAPLDLTDIHVIGSDFETTAITRWNKIDAGGKVTKMGSFFRVQNGLITEWMDSAVDGTPAAANPNSAACQTVNTALAAFAPATRAPP